MRQEWKDELKRLMFERKKFADLAAERRRDAAAFRAGRRWLDALQANARAAEYRRSRDERAAGIKYILGNLK